MLAVLEADFLPTAFLTELLLAAFVAFLAAFLPAAPLTAVFLTAVFLAGAAFLAAPFFATAFLAGAFLAGDFFAATFLAGAFFAAAFLAATFFEVPAPLRLEAEADFLEADLEALDLAPPVFDVALEAVFEGADLAADDLEAAFFARLPPEDLEGRFCAGAAAGEELSEERCPPSRSSSRSTESALTSLLKLLFSPEEVVSS